jgi:hypothetical protein
MPRFASFLSHPVSRQPGRLSSASNFVNIQNIRIASPCTSDWAKMTGDDRVRHCAECSLDVYNFSAMTAPEIEELVASRQGGRLCARIYRRRDGTILMRDCPRGLRALAQRVTRVAAAMLAAVMSFNSAWGQTAKKPKHCPPSAQPENHDSGLALNVIDPDGALIPKAEITLMRKDGKKRRWGVSDGAGRLNMAGLRAADYLITVKARGFRPAIAEVTLHEGKVLELQVKLRVEEVATEVSVVGETLVVQGTVGIIDPSQSSPIPMVNGGSRSPQPAKQ